MLCPFVQSPMYCNFPSFNNTAIVQKTANALRVTSLYKAFNIFPFSNACQYPFDQNATALPTFTCLSRLELFVVFVFFLCICICVFPTRSIVSCYQALLVCPFLCQTIGIVNCFTLLYSCADVNLLTSLSYLSLFCISICI